MAKQVRVWTGTQWEELAVQLPSADNPVFTGTTSSPMFSATQSVGDEGGEVKFAKAATNTTLNTGVTLDVYQDRVRLFETGGTNRGGYIDMSTLSTGVGTNLAPGLTLITSATGTTAASITIDNCFTSTYENYLVTFNGKVSARGELRAQYRDGTTDYTTNAYDPAYVQRNNSGLTSYLGTLTFIPIGLSETTGTSASLIIQQPQIADSTFSLYQSSGITVGTANSYTDGGCIVGNTTTFEGIKIYPSTGTITGTVRVYGYRNS